MEVPNRWVVYFMEHPFTNGWFRGNPIVGKRHIVIWGMSLYPSFSHQKTGIHYDLWIPFKKSVCIIMYRCWTMAISCCVHPTWAFSMGLILVYPKYTAWGPIKVYRWFIYWSIKNKDACWLRIRYLEVSWRLPKSSTYRWEFPSNKPSSCWGTPISGNSHIYHYSVLLVICPSYSHFNMFIPRNLTVCAPGNHICSW